MATKTYQDLNEYRLVWINPDLLETQYGTYLFNSIKEARPSIEHMKAAFPDFSIWLEDHDHNIVAN
jgi:hypothetical protein